MNISSIISDTITVYVFLSIFQSQFVDLASFIDTLDEKY